MGTTPLQNGGLHLYGMGTTPLQNGGLHLYGMGTTPLQNGGLHLYGMGTTPLQNGDYTTVELQNRGLHPCKRAAGAKKSCFQGYFALKTVEKSAWGGLNGPRDVPLFRDSEIGHLIALSPPPFREIGSRRGGDSATDTS